MAWKKDFTWFYRKSGKENLFRCTYVLPDGVTHTKGFVKYPDQARRYLALRESDLPSSQPVEAEGGMNYAELPEERKRVDLSKNVFVNVSCSVPLFCVSMFLTLCFHFVWSLGVWLDKWTVSCARDDLPSCWFGSVDTTWFWLMFFVDEFL